jgi:Ca2+-binding RTX toxin-like protein
VSPDTDRAMRLPKIPAATLAATLFALAAAGTADARVQHDPCTGTDAHFEGTRSCFKKFEIPGARTVQDEQGSSAWCKTPYGLRSSTQDWDYMTDNGEWVLWNLGGKAHRNDDHVVAFNPSYHNWAPWPWSVRTYLDCQIVGPVLVARIATVTDPVHEVGPDHTILEGPGDDVDSGTAQADELVGGKGDDTLSGGAGDDELLGGPGRDHLYGGAGDDELFDDQGEDVIAAGAGNDRISVRDGNHDVVDCGPGEDIAVGDPQDTFRHCEHVYTTAANTPSHPPVIR